MNTYFPKLNALMLICLSGLAVAISLLIWGCWMAAKPGEAIKHDFPSALYTAQVIRELKRKNEALAIRKAYREYDERTMRLNAIRREWEANK